MVYYLLIVKCLRDNIIDIIIIIIFYYLLIVKCLRDNIIDIIDINRECHIQLIYFFV